MNDALTFYVSVNEWRRNAYSLTQAGSTTWFEVNAILFYIRKGDLEQLGSRSVAA